MAVTRVERGGGTIWPWVLGLIALALLVWGLTEVVAGGGEAPSAAPPDSGQVDSP